jgi:hypothetical protein
MGIPRCLYESKKHNAHQGIGSGSPLVSVPQAPQDTALIPNPDQRTLNHVTPKLLSSIHTRPKKITEGIQGTSA